MAECVWTSEGGKASLRFRDVLGTRALVKPEERVKWDPVAFLYNCLQNSHRDGRTKSCVVATGTMASGSGHGLPHERLNVRKNDGGWCCRRTVTSTGEQTSAWCSWRGWMKPHVTAVGGSPPHGRSDWRPPVSRHYFEDFCELEQVLTFCCLIYCCPLLTEWLEAKSSVWQQEIKAFLFVFVQRQSRKGAAK